MAQHNFEGRVQRLYSDKEWTKIRIDIPAADQPADNYFTLNRDHANYNALFSMALSAAINGNVLLIRTFGDINPGEPGNVRYLVIDY